MKASETNFKPIIEGTKQYVVPLFQRAYSWKKEDWDVLWTDLMDLCSSSGPNNHFIGSIVTMPIMSTPEGVSKYLLIDGQQRITTIFILLTVIRDIAKINSLNDLADEINQTMLINPFKKEDDRFKLMPTQVDREIFKELILTRKNEQSLIGKCYQFFEQKIQKEKVDIHLLTKVITGRLSVVSIVLDRDDNPHLVFESLNAKGRALTQGDLIRNYYFMQISVNQQEKIYSEFWEPMENALGKNLTEFVRHYLMRNGSFVKQDDVYFYLKNGVNQNNALSSLKEIVTFASYYEKFLYPDKEPNDELQKSLKRIKRLEITTSYPFLLNCYHDYFQEKLSLNGFLEILQIIENFIIRRFVCNIPTNELNKIFPLLYSQAILHDPSSLTNGVIAVLQSRGYPKDNEFRSRLLESRLYGAGGRKSKTKFILESIEISFDHHEIVPFDSLTIEHIMPQTLTEWWIEQLGENWHLDHELCLHTLGNLTLTAYNSELSNDPFPNKKIRFMESHIDLNKYFTNIDNWNRDAIEERSNKLADQVIKIWPYFGTNNTIILPAEEVTGKTPRSLTFLGRTNTVASWRDVLTYTMNILGELDPDSIKRLSKEYPHLIGKDSNRFRHIRELNNGYYVEVNLSAKDIYRFCNQIIETIGLSSLDWVLEFN